MHTFLKIESQHQPQNLIDVTLNLDEYQYVFHNQSNIPIQENLLTYDLNMNNSHIESELNKINCESQYHVAL